MVTIDEVNYEGGDGKRSHFNRRAVALPDHLRWRLLVETQRIGFTNSRRRLLGQRRRDSHFPNAASDFFGASNVLGPREAAVTCWWELVFVGLPLQWAAW